MGSQVFLPAADARSPVALQAKIVRLRRDLQQGQRRATLALRCLQKVQALVLGLQGSAIAVGSLAQLRGQFPLNRRHVPCPLGNPLLRSTLEEPCVHQVMIFMASHRPVPSVTR